MTATCFIFKINKNVIQVKIHHECKQNLFLQVLSTNRCLIYANLERAGLNIIYASLASKIDSKELPLRLESPSKKKAILLKHTGHFCQ